MISHLTTHKIGLTGMNLFVISNIALKLLNKTG